MKENIDFLIRYEHKVRELESIMLIKIELERRGYSVKLVCNYEYEEKIKYIPKVLIVPAIYSDGQLYGDWYKYGLLKKIANLQWEQLIGAKEEDDINGYHNVKGIGTRILTFCWGEKSCNRLIKGGAQADKMKVVGQINTDLLRGNFKELLYTKKILSDKYGIDRNKKWYLFVSSFAYCEMDDQQAQMAEKQLGKVDFQEFTAASYRSRESILDWFEKELQNNPEIIVIYRPHPDETQKCNRLKEMTQRYTNFKMISNEAIKHWINACDKVYNWFSTGIIDAIVLRKPIRMLRPVDINEKLDYRIMHDSQMIKSERVFSGDYNETNQIEVFRPEIISSYYNLPQGYVYTSICDYLEEMLCSDKYDIEYSLMEQLYLNFIIYRRRVFNKIMPFFSFIPVNSWPQFIKKRLYVHKELLDMRIAGYNKNVASENDINEQYRRLRDYIYGK